MRPWKVVRRMIGMMILWASHYLYTVLPPNPAGTLSISPKWLLQANAICTNICVNRKARQLEGDTVKQVDEQWRILIWRSWLVKLYHATLCTLPLDLTSGSEFTTAGRSITTGRRCERRQFMWNLFCINMEMVLWKCCTIFTI